MHHNKIANWEFDKDFTGPPDKVYGSFCVRVNVLKLDFPRYSYYMGYIPPNGGPNDFKVFIQQDHDITDHLSVIFDAVDYIKQKRVEINAERAAKMETQRLLVETEAQERDRKKKQYEANVASKRNSNRARTAAGKKGNKEIVT